MWQHFGVLRVKRQKVSLNRQLSAYTCGGGGLGSYPTSMIQKQTVNATLAMGQQTDPVHCYNFTIFKTNLQYTIFTILFWDWGRWWIARINSWQYTYYLASPSWLYFEQILWKELYPSFILDFRIMGQSFTVTFTSTTSARGFFDQSWDWPAPLSH
jgi:hypothetical protein